ncbi:hypothetical protein PFICI_09229 [Pestalotiopsis fici W106-1]|uniref:Major facilitator superfamily (MFS) profile domain-containing protein n=1 Tax=Pestalotiopsis fici (strain W106-1 / CGMCC3.15140) TaxID=1229662 RepID=W3X2I9_PESFW|nr:uncharacterized protein PFICI_09229 [Pestalotiopsis fici W106-1]ETS79376.1 hypothetical protein PFICI_09229 [Pestalotiopsis fici W106-1]
MLNPEKNKTALGPTSVDDSLGVCSNDLVGSGEMSEVDEAMKRRVLRKTDFIILPMMCFVFFFQYLDKQSLAYASVYRLVTDLNLAGTQYSWTSAMFYVGQLVSEFPIIYLMSRLPLSRFVGITIVIWSIACMCLAAPKTYGQFLVARFFLGVTEGAVSPAFITITSIWYKKSEHPLRIGCWITCNGLASTLGALLMYGIGENNHIALAKWRVLFLICGGLTTALGVVFYFLMPDNPQTAWFLTPDERVAAAARLAEEHDGGDKTDFSMAQLREAMVDFNSYSAFLFGVLVTAPAPVLTFASLMIKRLGYTSAQTLIYNSPAGAVQILAIWAGVIACKLFPRNRCLVVVGLIMVPIAGCIMLLTLPFQGWPIIVGSWLGGTGSSIFTITMSLNASNVKGNTKKSIVNTLYFVGYCAGGIAFPQLWSSVDAPRYTNGLICSLTAWGLFVILMFVYWTVAARRNKSREKMCENHQVNNYEFGADVTDLEDKTFRYST